MTHAVILFDGVCNLCTWSVRFILQRDPRGYFRFAAVQSPVGQNLLRAHGVLATQTSSVILIEQHNVSTESDAALRIARQLSGLWPCIFILRVVPRRLRDSLYRWVAAHRYRWFGKAEQCMIPVPGVRERFLDDGTE